MDIVLVGANECERKEQCQQDNAVHGRSHLLCQFKCITPNNFLVGILKIFIANYIITYIHEV